MNNPSKKALSISGGATKLSALYGAAEYICSSQEFDVYAGVSAGAIIAPFAAIGKFDIDEILFRATEDDIFKIEPKFGLRNIVRLIMGKSLGHQGNLKDLIKEHFTEYEFSEMVRSGKEVLIGVSNFNAECIDKVFELLDICKMDYDNAIDTIYASTSIPFLTEGINGYRNGKQCKFYDGGISAHIPSPYLAKNYNLDHIISVFSRPDKVELSSGYEGKEGFESITRSTEIMTHIISKNNERMTDEICDNKGIKHTKIFMPYKLTDETYPTGYSLFKSWYRVGFYAAKGVLG